MPGTSVVFDTGPMARAHPETLAALGLQDLGDTATGFARFRLRL
jgi:2',3'-cyclic-nucleotide 2'-phosphodiesterase/3'-nucleotidase